jgi:hypothetical protein
VGINPTITNSVVPMAKALNMRANNASGITNSFKKKLHYAEMIDDDKFNNCEFIIVVLFTIT